MIFDQISEGSFMQLNQLCYTSYVSVSTFYPSVKYVLIDTRNFALCYVSVFTFIMIDKRGVSGNKFCIRVHTCLYMCPYVCIRVLKREKKNYRLSLIRTVLRLNGAINTLIYWSPYDSLRQFPNCFISGTSKFSRQKNFPE